MRTRFRAFAIAMCAGAASVAHAQAPHTIASDALRARLAAFAHDSMLGRETGTRGAVRAADYLVRELTAMRIKAAGDKGSYFQNVPMLRAKIDLETAEFSLDRAGGDMRLKAGVDYIPIVGHFGVPFGVQALPRTRQPLDFRGSLADIPDSTFVAQLRVDTLLYPERMPDSVQLAQPVVVMRAAPRADGEADFRIWDAAPLAELYRGATALLVESLDITPRAVLERLRGPALMISPDVTTTQRDRKKNPLLTPPVPPVIALTRAAANMLRILPGGLITLHFTTTLQAPGAPTRNVVAMIEGSDAQLRSEVVVLSAHLDHLGVAPLALRDPRDSIMNGADVGGSGAVALLEIAQHLASLGERPRRTIVFLWTVGEEQGMLGSQWFANVNSCGLTPLAEHVPVARQDHCQIEGHREASLIGDIVANINVDAIGRGGAGDIEHGGPDYVQVIGAAQLATEYASWIDKITHDPQFGLRPDDTYDVTKPHKRASCTGDHWSFSRLGIPSLFVTTGDHADARTPSDAPGTIDYEKLTKVTRLVAALTLGVANRDTRPALDDPVLGPLALCGQ